MMNDNLYRAEIDIVADLSDIEADESLLEAMFGEKYLIKLLIVQRFGNFIKRAFLQAECLLPNNQEIMLTSNDIEIDKNIKKYFRDYERNQFNLKVIIADDVPITQRFNSLLNSDEFFKLSHLFNVTSYTIGGKIKEIELNDNHLNGGKITVTDFQGAYSFGDINYQPKSETVDLTLENYNQLFWGDKADKYVQLENGESLPYYLVRQHLFILISADDIPVHLLDDIDEQEWKLRKSATRKYNLLRDIDLDFDNLTDDFDDLSDDFDLP
jgi:hypothetical protein